MSALFCLFLCFRSYPEKVEEYMPKFYKITYILKELYVAVMWIMSQLIIYIDQMNTANQTKKNIPQGRSWHNEVIFQPFVPKGSHTRMLEYSWLMSVSFDLDSKFRKEIIT